MEVIKLKGTEDTPSIYLDANKKHLSLGGRSLPEDATTFYKPILNWLDKYSKKVNGKTVVEFRFAYFNTASSKTLLDILTKLEALYKSGKDVVIRWLYAEDDEDMAEAGRLYAELVELPFEYISYSIH